MIESYKKAVNDGVICSPCPESFAAHCGTTQAALRELLERGQDRRSVYNARMKMYLLMLPWFRAEIAGGQHWPPRTDYMRKFLLLQDWGDGFRYIEKVDSKAIKQGKRFNINFGAGDRRSRSSWD